MDYSKVKSALLKNLRGEASTQEISRKLGYSFNQVRRWELGQKQLRWDEFFDFCRVLDIPIMDPIRWLCFLENNESEEDQARDFFLARLRVRFPHLSQEQLAKELNCHVSVLKRYLSGEIFPDLEFVFAFLDLRKNFLGRFISELTRAKLGAELGEIFQEDEAKVTAKLQWPISSAVEVCLDLADYRNLPLHDDYFIARKVACPVIEVRQILREMCELGTVVLDDTGKYRPNYQTINTVMADDKLKSRALHFWSKRALQRFEAEEPLSRGNIRSITAYRVAPASKKSMQKISEIIIKANDEILDVLEKDQDPTEEVRIILMHSFNANDIPDAILEAIVEKQPAEISHGLH